MSEQPPENPETKEAFLARIRRAVTEGAIEAKKKPPRRWGRKWRWGRKRR